MCTSISSIPKWQMTQQKKYKEAQLMLTNPRRNVFKRSFKVTKHSTIPYVRYSFLLVSIVTLSLRIAVFPIFDLKNVVTLKSGSEVTQGHWNWHTSISTHNFLLAFHSNHRPISHRFANFSHHLCNLDPADWLLLGTEYQHKGSKHQNAGAIRRSKKY